MYSFQNYLGISVENPWTTLGSLAGPFNWLFSDFFKDFTCNLLEAFLQDFFCWNSFGISSRTSLIDRIQYSFSDNFGIPSGIPPWYSLIDSSRDSFRFSSRIFLRIIFEAESGISSGVFLDFLPQFSFLQGFLPGFINWHLSFFFS